MVFKSNLKQAHPPQHFTTLTDGPSTIRTRAANAGGSICAGPNLRHGLPIRTPQSNEVPVHCLEPRGTTPLTHHNGLPGTVGHRRRCCGGAANYAAADSSRDRPFRLRQNGRQLLHPELYILEVRGFAHRVASFYSRLATLFSHARKPNAAVVSVCSAMRTMLLLQDWVHLLCNTFHAHC